MSASMKAYLAEKYMSGAKADAILSRTAPKKKKRKLDGAASSSLIKDDDLGFGAVPVPVDDDNELDAAVVEKSDRSFKKRKVADPTREGGWVRQQEESPPPAADELPLVVEEPQPLRGGIVSAAQFRSTLQPTPRKEDRETARVQQAEETIYRDKTGRKIDTKAERAEALRLRREREELEAKKMEWGKGLVQREEEERRKAEEEKERTRGLARYADDEELNDMQRNTARWNDPAAPFLSKPKTKGPRRPTYNGPTPPPNRFGIRPGYRWDGVDRSNGFEKRWFQKQNERQRRGNAAYEWSVEDM